MGAILGVAKDAPRARIRRAYLELAKRCHPDLHHGQRQEGAATAAFEKVQKAYKVLYDPDQRRAYDAMQAQASAPHNESGHQRSNSDNRQDSIFGSSARSGASSPNSFWTQM